MGRKSGFVAFILWGCGLFLLCGLHRIYIGRFWTGLLWFFTLGLCGVGQLIDLFRLGDMVRVANSEGGGSSRISLRQTQSSRCSMSPSTPCPLG
ncbi:hypothetical protein MBRA_06083 [Methylobacterium brachiatum]|nr:hypothetical protein MBRA_06083 [Methylobacterium brachiatum]